ncbi:MAG TPA: HEAT repeat domain-containing protein, partial [Anaerolineae bacterium]|nr:HEAT repeat domain-containing protein [Anaerolineae bacterium]
MCIAKIRRYRVKLLGRQRKVDAVADILRHSQHVVERQAAIEALTNSGDRRAVDLLIGALSDNDALVRATAAAGLGFLRDARAIAPLIGVLSGHPVVGAIAARSLVNI